MNKIVASLGLAAVGASNMNAVQAADELNAPPSKFWNVSASLRAFYDDNINTTPDDLPGVDKEGSFGFSFTPGFDLNWSSGATSARAGYRFTLNWYEKDLQDFTGTERTSMNHTFNGLLSHRFSERYRISLTDAFVLGQEPDQLRNPRDPQATNQRIPGDNIRNYANIVFEAQLTPLIGLQAGYVNGFVDYEADINDVIFLPSPSGAMDRVEHTPYLDVLWLIAPETQVFVGYQYGIINFTGDEPIGFGNVSSDRDTTSHFGYVGVKHRFRPDFYGSIRGGIQYAQFENADEDNEVSPYVKANLTYAYNPESRVEVGFSQSRSPTDIIGATGLGEFATDSDTTLLYGSITHCIISHRLYGSLLGTFQHNSLNGGSLDGETEQYFQLGLNLQYHINAYLMAEVGYNFDHVSSDIFGREYDRNRVYMGLTASY